MSNLNKKIYTAAVCLLLSALFCFSAFAANTSTSSGGEKEQNKKSTDIYLEYSQKEIKKGTVLKADLKIKNNQGFGTFTARIGFNNKKLKLKRIENKYEPKNYGNLHVDSNVEIANKNSWYKIGWTPTPVSPEKTCELVTYNGIYARFIFECLEDQTPNVDFYTVTLYSNDSAMSDLPYKLFANNKEVDEIYAAVGDDVALINSKIQKNYESSAAAEAKNKNKSVSGNGSYNLTNGDGSLDENSSNNTIAIKKLAKEKPWVIVLILIVIVLAIGLIVFLFAKKRGGKHDKETIETKDENNEFIEFEEQNQEFKEEKNPEVDDNKKE